MTQDRFPLFPAAASQPKGMTLRIYYSRPWKNAYAYIVNGIVTHVSPELVFAIGWTRDKLVARAQQVGFSISQQINMSKPRDTWLSARPAPVQVPLPSQRHGFIEPDMSFTRVAPPMPPQGNWQVNPMIDPTAPVEPKPRKPRKKKEKLL